MRIIQKNINGFTLVEIIITLAIISVVATALVTFILSISASRSKINSQHEVQSNMRETLDLISYLIHSSSGVNTSTSIFGMDPGVLSLIMSSSTLNPTIIDLNQDNGYLRIKEGDKPAVQLTSDLVKVSNFIFTDMSGNNSRKNIGINLTMEYNSDSQEYFFINSVTSSFSIRK